MNRKKYICCVALMLLLTLALFEMIESRSAGLSVPATGGGGVERSVNAATQKLRVVEGYGRLPLAFEANLGQTDTQVQFLSRGQGYTLFLTPEQAVFSLRRPAAAHTPLHESNVAPGFTPESQQAQPQPNAADSEPLPAVLRMSLLGANRAAAVSSEEKLSGRVNYILGNDPSKWRTNVPLFGKVRYSQVYAGIDLVYYGNQRQLEFDFVVAPGADPRQIRLHIEGASDRKLDTEGNLVLALDGGEVRFHKPLIYQPRNDVRDEIAGAFVLQQNGEIGFEVGPYDPLLPLVIDPVLLYSTYLGGNGQDNGHGIAVDSSGNAYVVGTTSSTNFPVASPRQASLAGTMDVFVTKFDSTGSALLYSTYFGGANDDHGNDIAVDTSGAAYVTGQTRSTDFPIHPIPPRCVTRVSCAFQLTHGGGIYDAFVFKLTASGALDYSTFLGGAASDFGNAIAVVGSEAYVAGSTLSTDFPIYPTTCGGSPPCAYQRTKGSGEDAFVTRLNANGTDVVYSTFLGGSGVDRGHALYVYGNGVLAIVAGMTRSPDFPTKSPAFQSACANSCTTTDAFVTILTADGSSLYASTFLGGTGNDEAHGVNADCIGNCGVHVTGYTLSTNFPLAGAVQNQLHGTRDAFVTKLNNFLSGLFFSTYWGGTSDEIGWDVALGGDSALGSNCLFVGGQTTSSDFPLVNSMQSHAGANDGFVTCFTSTGGSPLYSTLLGGAGNDEISAIAANLGYLFVTGRTSSTDLPTANAFQPVFGGGFDAFVAKLSGNRPPVANAGPDQVVVAWHPTASNTPFTLDGSFSSDPEGDPLTFEWRDSSNTVVGAAARVNLTGGMGVHVFTLKVNDGRGGIATDSVTVNIVADITPPAVQVIRPNGGEKLFVNTPYVIEWTAADDGALNSFDVFFSVNGGTNYNPVPGCASVSGALRQCTWASPGPTTTTARVRVAAFDAFGNTATDASNTNFSIVTGTPAVTVTAPNTVVDWGIGATHQIKWTHNLGLTSYMKIEVSRDNGATWSVIAASFKNTGAGASTYNWQVTGPGSFAALVRVSWANGPSASDTSNARFTISEPYIVVSTPGTTITNYGYGTKRTQTWTTNLGPGDRVNVLLSTDGGVTFPVTLASNLVASTKTVTYTTPTLGAPTGMARIRVVWVANGAIYGNSPVNFGMQPPFLWLLVPDGPADVWTIGSTQTFIWAHNLGASENVKVELSLDGGQTYSVVVLATTPSDGTQAVVVQGAWATQTARLSITWLTNSLVTDFSNQDFRIQ